MTLQVIGDHIEDFDGVWAVLVVLVDRRAGDPCSLERNALAELPDRDCVAECPFEPLQQVVRDTGAPDLIRDDTGGLDCPDIKLLFERAFLREQQFLPC